MTALVIRLPTSRTEECWRGPPAACVDAFSARTLAQVTDGEPIWRRSVTFLARIGETIPLPLAPGCYLVVTYSPVVKLLA